MTRRLAAMFAILASATGCATMSVSSHMEPHLNTAAYHTFSWGPRDTLPTGDPRLDQDPFFKDHVEGAVEKQMAARGFRLEEHSADLEVHYHAVITPRLDVNRVDHDHGYCYDETCSARVLEYEQGTLVVDIVDTRTYRVIWRGWAQETIEPALRNQDRMARDINIAVERMLARFPLPQ